jgi:two-component system, NtrC family, response regulator AtoC
MGASVIFVGQVEAIQQKLLHLAGEHGDSAECVPSAEAALKRIERDPFDLLMTDLALPGITGLELLSFCQRDWPHLITTVATSQGTIADAVAAMKCGASDFLTLHVSDEEFTALLQIAAERAARRTAATNREFAGGDVITRSLNMLRLLNQAAAIARFNTTVLVTGETGTGKEMIARAIHQHSTRRLRPMIALNCAAIPDNLLEDELFGHVKGAFTGAHTAREGRFEYADGGTLFLDEIGDMSLPLQAKLLRVLQEREFEKLGSSRSTKVDVRIIAATSADLDQKVKEGSFRLDLYYRLNVMHLRLPPLRERRADIRPLAEELLARFCLAVGLPPKRIDEEVWALLEAFSWPGNVRQLQNAMERAAALSGASPLIQAADLPEEVRGPVIGGADAPFASSGFLLQPALPRSLPFSLPEEGVSLDAVVTNIERELLLRSLNQTGGNKMQAAKLLKMKRTTFVEKLKRLQIDDPDDAASNFAFGEVAGRPDAGMDELRLLSLSSNAANG